MYVIYAKLAHFYHSIWNHYSAVVPPCSRYFLTVVSLTYSGLLGLELFLPLQSILFNLCLSFFLGLFQTPVLTWREKIDREEHITIRPWTIKKKTNYKNRVSSQSSDICINNKPTDHQTLAIVKIYRRSRKVLSHDMNTCWFLRNCSNPRFWTWQRIMWCLQLKNKPQ